jgi:RNA polymerase sigma factor (sigma-70 family)
MNARPAHFARLLQFLKGKGRSHEDAEDLIQEAMLRLHVYSKRQPVPANEEAFLVHAVQNLSIDQHRRDRPDLRRQIPLDAFDGATHPPLITEQPTPEDTLAAEQRLHSIKTLLDVQGHRTREIYFAHRAGYSYDEIADHLRISHITIKRHIARALLVIMEHGPLD